MHIGINFVNINCSQQSKQKERCQEKYNIVKQKSLINKKLFLLFAVLLAAVALRFVYLDQDQPANNLSGFTQGDEPYYCYAAVHDQMVSRPGFPETFVNSHSHISGLHNYLTTKLSFSLFGYNYTGMRLVSVMGSLLVIWLLFISLFRYYKEERNPILWFLFALFLLVDPYFLITSRLQNPQIDSIVWLSIGLYFVYTYSRTSKPIYLVLAVFVHVFTVLFVYPYTLFALLGLGFYILFLSFKKRSPVYMYYAIIGALMAILLFVSILYARGSTPLDFIHNLLRYNVEKSEVGLKSFSSIDLTKAPLQIFYSNLIRYNLFYLLLFGGLILVVIKRFRSMEDPLIFTTFVIAAAFIQCTFVVSYPFKKWVAIFPYFATLIIPIYLHFKALLEENSRLKFIAAVGICMAMIVAYFNMHITNNHEYWKGFDYGFIYKNPSLMLRWTPFVIFSISALLFLVIIFNKKLFNPLTQTIGVIVLMGSIAMSYELLYKEPRYEYKTFLQDSAPILNGKIIVGDLSHAYTFYNNSLVLVSYYAEDLKIDSRLKENISKFDPNKLIYIKNYLPGSKVSEEISNHNVLFKKIKDYPGEIYCFAIYEPK